MSSARFVSRTACVSCGSADLAVLDTGTFEEGIVHQVISTSPHGEDPLPALRGARWTLAKCGACAQIFHREVLDPDWMAVAYSRWSTAEAMEEFVRRAGGASFDNLFHAARARDRHVLQIERLTQSLRGDAAVRLLDFGCGKGEFVETCLAHDFDAVGVDFSTARQESARVPIVPSLDDVSGDFHAITLFEVLEHVERPRDILGAVAGRLVADGILVVEVPDCTGVSAIRTTHDHALVDPIEHINGFTPATLTRIVEQAGFTRIRRPIALCAAGPKAIVRACAGYVLGRGERSTQQYFRKRG